MVKKAELHVHLEGTITPDLARKLAHRNNKTLRDGLIAPDNRRYLSRDFLNFLSVEINLLKHFNLLFLTLKIHCVNLAIASTGA